VYLPGTALCALAYIGAEFAYSWDVTRIFIPIITFGWRLSRIQRAAAAFSRPLLIICCIAMLSREHGNSTTTSYMQKPLGLECGDWVNHLEPYLCLSTSLE
jgi:hypothetical protein